MRKRAQREGIFIGGLAFAQKLNHKVAAAHVVHQVTELFVAERVVAHVLNHRAAICIRVSLPHLVIRQARITGQDHGPQVIVPQQIDDLFMGENRIRMARTAVEQQRQNDCNGEDDLMEGSPTRQPAISG